MNLLRDMFALARGAVGPVECDVALPVKTERAGRTRARPRRMRSYGRGGPRLYCGATTRQGWVRLPSGTIYDPRPDGWRRMTER